jgi:hypothetical protein
MRQLADRSVIRSWERPVAPSCGPRTIKLDIDVLPRRIENWTYSDDDNDWYDFHGTSPCGHMHFASLFN